MHYNFSFLIIALGFNSCAPRALYFHETTKVGFAADYNTSDSQPLATSFGFKRRIVAVVPTQERVIPDGGSETDGTNRGEALSLVSKFNVRAGTAEGIAITNNFASGMAARIMTHNGGPAESVNAVMHSAPIEVSATTGDTRDGISGSQAVNERLAQIRGKRFQPPPGGHTRGRIDTVPPKSPMPAETAKPSSAAPSTTTTPLPASADESRGEINSVDDAGKVLPEIVPPPRE